MTEVVNYAKIAIDSYEERGDLSSPSPLVSQPVVLLTQIAFTLALAKEGSVAGSPATETGITITNVLLLLYEAQDAVAAAHEVEARG